MRNLDFYLWIGLFISFITSLYSIEKSKYSDSSGLDIDIHHNEKVFSKGKIKDDRWSRMNSRFVFTSEGFSFNNADLRKLNESSQSIINYTDDQIHFIYSQLDYRIHLQMDQGMDFISDLSFFYLWGTSNENTEKNLDQSLDSIEVENNKEGSFYFCLFSAYFVGEFMSSKENHAILYIGRRWFQMNHFLLSGKIDDSDNLRLNKININETLPEYVMDSYIDSIGVGWNISSIGMFYVAADIMDNASDIPQNSSAFSNIPEKSSTMDNFNGDVHAIRFSGVYRSRNLFHWKKDNQNDKSLQFLLYSFYIRYGASHSGAAERSLEGSAGNFPDGDWNSISGSRWLFQFPFLERNNGLQKFQLFFDFAYSRGKNYRLPWKNGDLRDIQSTGTMVALGYSWPILIYFKIHGSFGVFTGSKINSDNEIDQYGFVSASSVRAAGFLLHDYWNLHPTAFSSSEGVHYSKDAFQFASGLSVAHLGFSFHIKEKYTFRTDLWYLKDQSKKTSSHSSECGEARCESHRSGKEIGYEFNTTFYISLRSGWDAYIRYGIFFPGEYFSFPGSSTFSPAGKDPFTGIQIGMKAYFKI